MGDQNGNLRISLPPGTVLRGAKGSYTVQNILCTSERSVTVSCRSADQKLMRLKYYNGASSVTSAMLRKLCAQPVRGTVLPADIGEHGGMPFAVYPNVSGKSADQSPISLEALVQYVIPQLSYVIAQYHSKRILLRDICPEHIFYSQKKRQIAYFGFGNAAELQGRATVTREPGKGQAHCYIAPEAEQYGYSTCSDYFSLGITLLTILKGRCPVSGMSRQSFLDALSRGTLPGTDLAHLKKTPFNMYSEEDRVMFLILGLTLPDPRKRWGLGEMRCWMNRQPIPLVQSGTRIAYQFNESFKVGSVSCWNQKMLAAELARQKSAWNDATASSAADFAAKMHLSCAGEMTAAAKDRSLTGPGKIFRCIYLLDPALDGLWWNGTSYKDMRALVAFLEKHPGEKGILHELLVNRCFSFFGKARVQTAARMQQELAALTENEQFEQNENGKGVSRCMMLYAASTDSRSFVLKGKSFHSVGELLADYGSRASELKKVSAELLQSQSFQAWLWANGMEKAATQATAEVKKDSERAFYLLLSLCEAQVSGDKEKRSLRELFLHWGDFAPVVWLTEHISEYKLTSEAHRPLYDELRKPHFDLSQPLDRLRQNAQKLVIDYQNFVSRTLDNPFMAENGAVLDGSIGYLPSYEDGYFCCKWNGGLEVCPAFLRTVGEKPDRNAVTEWINGGVRDESERLRNLRNKFPGDDVLRSNWSEYPKECRKNIAAAVFMIILPAVLMFAGFGRFELSEVLMPLGFGIAALFPFVSIMWYHKRLVRSTVRIRNCDRLRDQVRKLDRYSGRLNERADALIRCISECKHQACQPSGETVNDPGMNPDAMDPLLLTIPMRILAYLSIIGFMELAAVLTGDFFEQLLWMIGYGLLFAGGLPVAVRKGQFVDSCFNWALTVVGVTLSAFVGTLIFGEEYLTFMVALPFILGIIALVVVVGLAFFG